MARRSTWLMLLLLCATLPLLAQAGERTLTVHYSAFLSPVIALIAGILILIMPRLLNYVVAIYLIIVGLLGLLR